MKITTEPHGETLLEIEEKDLEVVAERLGITLQELVDNEEKYENEINQYLDELIKELVYG